MAKFKITEGAEKDFDGAPDWAAVLIGLSTGKYYIEKSGAGFPRVLNINTGNEFTIPADLQFGDTIIAQREPIADDGWIEWNGGDCPVQKGTLVDVKYRDGEEVLNLKALEIDNGYGSDASWAFWKHCMSLTDIIAYRLSKPEAAEAPAWNGEGLPPVGVECEWRDEHGRYNAGKIVYSSEWVIVFRDGCLDVEIALDSKFNPEGCVFRPIRSPEEYEREKAIDEMVSLFVSHYENPKGSEGYINIATSIYDAGYRKVK